MSLAAEKITSGYGRVPIIHGVSIEIPSDGIAVILGPNGAGKSTLLKALACQLPLMDGHLSLNGERYEHLGPTWAARAGIALVGQSGNVFGDLTVKENLRLGALHSLDPKSDIAAFMERFPILADRAAQRAESLSGGERQLLAVTSALLMEPSFLLLDEPTTGLAPLAAQATIEVIDDIVQSGVGVAWVVEQMPELAVARADVAYFMAGGQVSRIEDPTALLETGRLEEMMLS